MLFDKDLSFSTPAKYDKCKKNVILANGFSKAFAMTGWRLGVVIAPDDVISKMGLLLQTTSSCVSAFIQRAGIEAVTGEQTEANKMMEEYRIRRDVLVDGLNSIKGIKCLRPGGAFYVFPNIKGTGLTSDQFSELMLEEAGVALLPGNNFGHYGEGYVRLCYAASKERIAEGLKRIKAAVESL
jgi:aspartate/methionine/tyrosine aminotransferase